MIRQIYINDQLMDLSEEDPIALTYAVNDLADLKDRQSTFSSTVKFPKTTNNCIAMGYADNDNFSLDFPYKQLSAKIVQNGIEIVPNGLYNLTKITAYFEGQIISGIGGLASFIEDKKLADLDTTTINHAYTSENILASQSNVTGYIYPVIDYGRLSDTPIVSLTSLKPAVFTKTVIDLIIKQAGYKYSGDVFNDPVLSNEIIPFTNDFFGKNVDGVNIPYNIDDVVNMAACLPDIKQKDFLKDFMQRYGLTPVVDNYAKTVAFYNFSRLYKNKSKAIDWTSKFINSDISDEFIFGNYAQVNNAIYKQDNTVTSLYGNGLFTINNKNLEGQTDIFESVFAATLTVVKLGGIELSSIPKYDPTDYNINNKVEPRVLMTTNISNPNVSLVKLDGSSITPTVINVAYFKKTGLPGLGYNELLTRNYQSLFKILERVRKLTRYVSLNEVDLQQLDHFIPIYDARSSKYYYLNKIIDYIPGQPTQVELIRM